MVRLSQCMIVKNEEKNIKRALEWAKDMAYEQIVVDTGSTDCTVEIAESMGAKVYHFKWIDDFAAAKNYAIEQAGGDWIAFLDADEYLTKENALRLPDILDRIDRAKVRNALNEPAEIDIIRSDWIQINNKGNISQVLKQERFFRRKKEIRYNGIIHETLTPLKGYPITVTDVGEEIGIYHTGYAWTPELRHKKAQRNQELIARKLQNDDSAEAFRTYADALVLNEDYLQAKKYFQMAVDKRDGTINGFELQSTYRQLLLLLIDIATKEHNFNDAEFEKYYNDAKQLDEEYPDFDMAAGYWHYEKKEWTECIDCLERAIDYAGRKQFKYSVIYNDVLYIYSMLATCYGNIRNYGKSVYYASLTLKEEPYEEKVLIQLIQIFKAIDNTPEKDIVNYLRKIYNLDSQKDVLYLLKISKKINNQELEKEIKPYLSDENMKLIYPHNG